MKKNITDRAGSSILILLGLAQIIGYHIWHEWYYLFGILMLIAGIIHFIQTIIDELYDALKNKED